MAILDLLAAAFLLLQPGSTDTPGFVGLARFFAGLLLVLTIYTGAWLFTYWISKDE